MINDGENHELNDINFLPYSQSQLRFWNPESCENLFIFDLLEYIWSTGITLGSLAVIRYGASIGAYLPPYSCSSCLFMTIITKCILFYLEGLMIAIMRNQQSLRKSIQELMKFHCLMNQSENVKRFIIGR
jgi:hypothetical protein